MADDNAPRPPYSVSMPGLEIPLNLPDLWQQEAVRALRDGADVIVDAPTGAGKTRVFELYAESGDATRRGQAVFTVPTRALANDKWREWRARGWNVGIATGDVAVNIHAPVLVATLETQRERILARRPPALLAIDEYQMLADPRRGLNYELALALCPPDATQLLLLSGSVRNPADVAEWLTRLGRNPRLVREDRRPVPLDELPGENLPRVPDTITGFWPRLAAGAWLAGLTPLLVFAPRRTEAEKIARKIAEALPPEDPITLRPEDETLLGRDLARLIRRRVAYHHSGLPYAARAGWVEALAKNGQLRVVVATTGLAAGINFSVRSVLVADTTYHDGPFQRELRPDELLQMFGRAGRRGIDPRGCVIVARNGPRLGHAAPRQLRRVNELDWPTLLRVMEEAAVRGEPPVAAAEAVGARLFSRQTVGLGFDQAGEDAPDPDRFGPTREEFLDSEDAWRPLAEAREKSVPLADCLVRHRDAWKPALRVAAAAEKFGPGRLCRLPRGRGFEYGKELVVARRSTDGRLAPQDWVRHALHLGRDERFTAEEFLGSVAPLLDLRGARPLDLAPRGPMIALRVAISGIAVPATVDAHQRPLLDPPRRRVAIARETRYGEFQPRPGTPAHAWRKLGLVDAEGRPTARGRVFSRFQAGEGLMIAAALEDATYDAADLVNHLANLRGGHRFRDDEREGASARLAFASRAAYGHVDHEGYLRTGLGEGYGENAWETIERHLAGKSARDGEASRGDVERAILEWKSLLRHIVHAPDADAPRWRELQAAAAARLESQSGPPPAEITLPATLNRRATERPIRLAALTG